MTTETLTKTPLWKEFEAEARRQRRDPFNLLTEFMREQIEIWEHKRLDKEIRAEAQKSGYTEDDAVELVRQYRREKRERAAS